MIINPIGGGTTLNFKVVGGTSVPSNPAENTIWVNTDTEITSWYFSLNEPSSPTAGMVWFKTVANANTVSKFNALKKNGIEVYPISCFQYIDGSWVAKTAKTYQDGAWVDWIFWVFKHGEGLNNAFTGFTNSTIAYDADKIYSKSGHYNGTCGGYENVQSLTASSGSDCEFFTNETIDVTQYSTAHFSGVTFLHHAGNGANTWISFQVKGSSTAKYTKDCGWVNTSSTAISNGSFDVDISGLSGEAQIGVIVGCGSEYTEHYRLVIENIWLD